MNLLMLRINKVLVLLLFFHLSGHNKLYFLVLMICEFFFYIGQQRVYLTLPPSCKMFLVREDAVNFELLDTNFHL